MLGSKSVFYCSLPRQDLRILVCRFCLSLEGSPEDAAANTETRLHRDLALASLLISSSLLHRQNQTNHFDRKWISIK